MDFEFPETEMSTSWNSDPDPVAVIDAPQRATRKAHLRLVGRRDPSEESILVERLKAGDEAAFEVLVSTHRERMLAVARRFLPEEEDARDAVQDAFFAAHRSIDRFEGQARISTWLHRVVVNACLMKLRSRRRKPEQSLSVAREARLVSDHSRNAHDDLESRQISGRVRDAIAALPESHRRVLQLRDIEERDTRETAEMLAITPAAVKTRLHRARTALRSRLRPDGSDWAGAPLQQLA